MSLSRRMSGISARFHRSVVAEDYRRSMATTMAGRSRAASRTSRGDLSGTAVVLLAFLALGVVTWLDLTDSTLGPAFAVGFVLTALTAPMAVSRASLVTTGALPPVLLIMTLFVVAVLAPDAVATSGLAVDAGAFARTIAATLDHGMALVIGHVMALTAIALRSAWGVQAERLRATP